MNCGVAKRMHAGRVHLAARRRRHGQWLLERELYVTLQA